jgi:hypothetical protein
MSAWMYSMMWAAAYCVGRAVVMSVDICNAFLEGGDFRWLRYTAGSTGNNPCPPKTNYCRPCHRDRFQHGQRFRQQIHQNMQITGDDVAFDVESWVTPPKARFRPFKPDRCRQGVRQWQCVGQCHRQDRQPQRAARRAAAAECENIIAVASSGGVGKSTTAVEPGALAAEGASAGPLDADIYGPSQPMMMGIEGPESIDGKNMEPMENYGIQVMSIGFWSAQTKR